MSKKAQQQEELTTLNVIYGITNTGMNKSVEEEMLKVD